MYRVVYSRKTNNISMRHESHWFEKEGLTELIEYLTKVPEVKIEKIEQLVDATHLFAQYKL